MKAVIVDIKKIYAAALSDDGCIKKVINKNYAIGQVIEMKKSIAFKGNKFVKIGSIAAAFLIFCGIGAFTYFHPSTYVSLDVNPSIEYSLNMFDRVLSVKGVNDDGTEIVSELTLDNLSNKTIDEAIALTVQEITKQGYLDSDIAGEIVITTSAKDLKKAANLADELKAVSEQKIREKNLDVEVVAEGVGKERVDQARQLGLTPGKLNLIEKLQESSSDPSSITVEEWSTKSVKDIKKAIKANKISSSLTAEQTEQITPALETFKTEIGLAEENFNTAFEAIKADYTSKIEAAKTEITVPEELDAKLAELRESMLAERRVSTDALKAALSTAKANFMQTVASFGIDENLLKNYLSYVVDQEINTKDGFKVFLKLFDNENDNDESEASEAEESESEESKTESRIGYDNGKGKGNKGKPEESKINEDESEIEESEAMEPAESKEIDQSEAVVSEDIAESEAQESEAIESEENDDKDQDVSRPINGGKDSGRDGKGKSGRD